MRRIHLLLLSLLSGLLLSAAWPMHGFAGIIFVALVPLLLVEDFVGNNRLTHSRFSVLWYAWISFFVFNILTTWWIVNSTVFGMIMAVVLNSLFLSLAFLVYHIVRRIMFAPGRGHFALILFWMTWEYLHLDWDLSWSWLNLGNVFASRPAWVQWYEYTGTFGGTLWILMVNIMVFWIIRALFLQPVPRVRLWITTSMTLLLLVLPLLFSWIRYQAYVPKGDPVEVVIVQPNIDPYEEQYDLEVDEALRRNLLLAEPLLDSSVQYLVCPESALQEVIWEGQEEMSLSVRMIREFLLDYPRLKVVIGASTFKRYAEDEKTHTARWHKSGGFWYDAFNTSLYIENGVPVSFYHKSVLVPGVEKMPFRKYLAFMDKFAIDLGGTVGSIGTDPVRKVIQPGDGGPAISSTICYESAYGGFFSGFARNGAQLLFVITNDGWWGNTPGHRQHLLFSSLRAIETRKDIGRSANTGISCFVDQRGRILQATDYWTPDVIRGTMLAHDGMTFYVRQGDYLARIAAFVSAMFLLIALVQSILGRRKLTANQ